MGASGVPVTSSAAVRTHTTSLAHVDYGMVILTNDALSII